MGDFQSPDLIQERIDYERRSELVQDEQGDFSEALISMITIELIEIILSLMSLQKNNLFVT